MKPGPHDVLSQILSACKAERAVTASIWLHGPRASHSAGTEGALIRMCTGPGHWICTDGGAQSRSVRAISSCCRAAPRGAFAGMETIAWAAFFAPASTPHAIIQRQSAAIADALTLPNIREHFARLGSEPAYMPPQQATGFVRAQLELWTAKIRDAGIEPQ
uniref:tripartite tricarboxylate transporter substrate-binding protein n=1 Tax=Cupriavidus taiwanensis TaxID=164546 RepID=UPI003F497212